MFTFSPQEKIIIEFYKNDAIQKFTHLILNTVLLPEWSTAVFLFSEYPLFVLNRSTAVLQKKIFQLPQILWFSKDQVLLTPWELNVIRKYEEYMNESTYKITI